MTFDQIIKEVNKSKPAKAIDLAETFMKEYSGKDKLLIEPDVYAVAFRVFAGSSAAFDA